MHLRMYDVPPAISARAVVQMAAFRTMGALAVMALASVTPNLGRFALVGGGLPQLDETWLADAELVIVRSTYRGSVLRTLEMTGVRVPRM